MLKTMTPLLEIIPLNWIVHVTKQRSFSKAMIGSSTEISIFLDEACPRVLEIDD